MGNENVYQLVIETEEYLIELNRVLEPLYSDGFKRWSDVRKLIHLTAKAYLDPLEESPYTFIQKRLYSDDEIGRILGVLGRFDEEVREHCKPYFEDQCVYSTIRQTVDKPYLVVEFVDREVPQKLSFPRYIRQLQENGDAVDASILRALRHYESQLPHRRAKRYG